MRKKDKRKRKTNNGKKSRGKTPKNWWENRSKTEAK